MHQQINKKKVYFYIFSFLFLTTLFNQNLLKILKEKISLKNIVIKSNNFEIRNKINNSTKDLINKNIFFINKELLNNKLNSLLFLENINIKKKYPSTIIIEVKKTELIAITYLDKKKYFVGNNGNLILSKKISNNKKIPIIFGKFESKNFLKLRDELSKIDFDSKKIIKYYSHKTGRWDLIYNDNLIVKLPIENRSNALNLLNNFKKQNYINSNTVIDLRVHNRLILKNE